MVGIVRRSWYGMLSAKLPTKVGGIFSFFDQSWVSQTILFYTEGTGNRRIEFQLTGLSKDTLRNNYDLSIRSYLRYLQENRVVVRTCVVPLIPINVFAQS